MTDDRELAQKLVQALRRIEADAEGALLHGGNLPRVLEAIRDAAGAEAACERPPGRSRPSGDKANFS